MSSIRPTHRRIGASLAAQFSASLPTEARPYVGVIIQVSDKYDVDPFLIAAIGQQESRWGHALQEDLTGDHVPRRGKMPPDGFGWGRGLMQLDYGSMADWLALHDWKNPTTNVEKGVEVLMEKYAFLSNRQARVKGVTDTPGLVTLSPARATSRYAQAGDYPDPRPLFGDALLVASVAAYNTGELNVLLNLTAGLKAEKTSAHGRYATDVLGKMWHYAGAFTKSLEEGT
jgi:hypothetical protein